MLLERDSDVARLEELLDAARAGDGGLTLIEAPAGRGKTALLEAALTAATDAGMLALRARANQLESEFAFGVVRQCFEGHIRRQDASSHAVLFAGAAGHAAPILGFEAAAEVLDSAEARQRALYGLYWLLANIAEAQPVVLAVDDLHWADASSLLFLDFLMSRVPELRVAIIATVRSDEMQQAGATLQRIALRAPATITPKPLSRDAVGTLLEREMGSAVHDDFVDACHRVVTGNPFFLQQLLAELKDDHLALDAASVSRIERLGPRAVHRVVVARISHLPATALQVAKAVAVLGGEAQPAHVRELAGVDAEEADRGADGLVAATLLDRGERLSFVHPIVQNAVYEEIGPRERSRLHRKAAGILARHRAPVERLAAHILASDAESDPWAVDILSEAARTSLVHGAPEAAMTYLRRALDEEPSPDIRRKLLPELATVEINLASPDAPKRAKEWLAAAVEPFERARAAMALAMTLTLAGRVSEAFTPIAMVHQEIGAVDPSATAWLNTQIACFGWLSEESAPFGAMAAAALPDAAEDPQTNRMIKIVRAAYGAFTGEMDVVEAGRLLREGLSGPDALTELPFEHPIQPLALLTALGSHQEEAVETFLRDAIAEVRRRGSLLGTALLLHWRAYLRLQQGLPAEAAEDARLAFEASVESGWTMTLPSAVAIRIDAVHDAEGSRAAAALLRELEAMDGVFGSIPDTVLLETRGRLRVAEGDVASGLEDLRRAGEGYLRSGMPNPAISQWRTDAALAALRLGDSDEARRLADEELELARRFGAARALGVSLRTAGLVHGDVDLLTESVDTLEQSYARLELARSLCELGAALRRSNQRSDATLVLGRADELARSCGSVPLVQRVHEELGAAGSKPRATAVTGVDALTPSERRVAVLASQGLSNPEIAQTLFVTRKTVEKHLGNAYLKLAITSRAELGTVFRRDETAVGV